VNRIRWGYLVALVPVATDWIDTGHFPVHLREVVTEVIVGLILAAFVHALYRDADRYRSLSETDPLTGLPNRRRFEDDLAREVRRAGEAPLAVAFADVDAFKEINDTHGHETGDEVLRAVGHALRGSLRSGDGAYRIGGDEFAVILPGASATNARAVLSEALAGHDGGLLARFGVTLSIGIEERRAGESARALLGRSDAAMYEAKGARAKSAGLSLEGRGRAGRG
jgi:diguanylate cyclase (GGDEF)-like protein